MRLILIIQYIQNVIISTCNQYKQLLRRYFILFPDKLPAKKYGIISVLD